MCVNYTRVRCTSLCSEVGWFRCIHLLVQGIGCRWRVLYFTYVYTYMFSGRYPLLSYSILPKIRCRHPRLHSSFVGVFVPCRWPLPLLRLIVASSPHLTHSGWVGSRVILSWRVGACVHADCFRVWRAYGVCVLCAGWIGHVFVSVLSICTIEALHGTRSL